MPSKCSAGFFTGSLNAIVIVPRSGSVAPCGQAPELKHFAPTDQRSASVPIEMAGSNSLLTGPFVFENGACPLSVASPAVVTVVISPAAEVLVAVVPATDQVPPGS